MLIGRFGFRQAPPYKYLLCDTYRICVHRRSSAVFICLWLFRLHIGAAYTDALHRSKGTGENFTIMLYFKPQSYFYPGLIISCLRFTGCLGQSAVGLAKKKTEKYSQPPQISPTRCRIEEERWAIILTGLFNVGGIEYDCMGNLSAPRI